MPSLEPPGTHSFIPDDKLEPQEFESMVDTITERLAEQGLSEEIIAFALDSPVQRVRAVVSARRFHTTVTREPTEEEKKTAAEVGKLSHLALREAFLMLEFGTSDQKLAIIKSILPALARAVSTGETSGADEMRVAFDAVLHEMKKTPILETVITETDFIDVEVDASAEHFDDQD